MKKKNTLTTINIDKNAHTALLRCQHAMTRIDEGFKPTVQEVAEKAIYEFEQRQQEIKATLERGNGQ